MKKYRLLDPTTGKIKDSLSVVFKEKVTENTVTLKDIQQEREEEEETQETHQEEVEAPDCGSETEIEESPQERTKGRRQQYRKHGEKWKDILRESTPVTTRRSSRDQGASSVSMAMMAIEDSPRTYQEAIESEESDQWKKAMDEEMESVKENETWTLEKLPERRQAVSCKWVYVKKRNNDGEVGRFKARLVARGFSQQEGIDYNETFSPVVRFDSLRVLLSIAANDLEMKQFDIKTAFLYGKLEEEIFMKQPPGYQYNENLVCRLTRRLLLMSNRPMEWPNERIELLWMVHELFFMTQIWIKYHKGNFG
jgi:hypothetical protein